MRSGGPVKMAGSVVAAGLQRVNDQGKVARAAATATTLDEVARLAGRLRTELVRRGVHPEVLRYCEEELLRKSLFHAVFEATKDVSERLRQMSGRPRGTVTRLPVPQAFGVRSSAACGAAGEGLQC